MLFFAGLLQKSPSIWRKAKRTPGFTRGWIKLEPDKSEYDKRVLQRNSREDFATFFERARTRIGRIWIRWKLLWGASGSWQTRAWGSRQNTGFWATKKKGTIVPNCSKEELMPIIQGKILKGSTIHTDGWKAYDGLILNGYNHCRVFHSENEFARGKSHVNGIKCFWSYAKRRFAKFNGLTDAKFILHLKETECRYHRNDNFASFIEHVFWGKL